MSPPVPDASRGVAEVARGGRCPSCNTPVAAELPFCGQCGTRLTQVRAAHACTRCGRWEDVLHRLVDIWATGEASASLGFEAARLFDRLDPLEREKDRLLAEKNLTGRAAFKELTGKQQTALELLKLSALPVGPREPNDIETLQADPLGRFVILDSLANVLCPACKLWNTGHGANVARSREPHGRLRRHGGLPGLPRPKVDGRPARSNLRRPGSRAAVAAFHHDDQRGVPRPVPTMDARGLVETYDGAPAVAEALDIAEAAYRELGMDDLAEVVVKVRAENQSPDLVSPTAAMAGLATGSAAAGPTEGSAGGSIFRAGPARRDGRWEARVGASVGNSADVDFDGGTTARIDGGVGFLFGVGYHYNDHLQFGSTLAFDQKDYDAEIAGDADGESFTAEGSLDTMSLMLDASYNFLTGPFTPFVVGSIGWNWVDTNVATEPPSVGCWWHPWYGYICTSWQDTRTVDGFAYELGVGMRYDFNDTLAADGSYRMRWVDFDHSVDTPSFDAVQLNLVWKF